MRKVNFTPQLAYSNHRVDKIGFRELSRTFYRQGSR
jgi:hypothetical protein